MQSLKPAVLFGALLFTGMLAAQATARAQASDSSQTPAAPAKAPAARVQAPNPGTGGGSGQLPNAAPLSREDQIAKIKADANHMSELQAEAFARQLHLTPSQVKQLKPILVERQQKLRDAVAQTPDSEVDRNAKIDKIREETQTKIEGILYPPQKAQYERLIAAHRSARSPRATRPAGTPMAPGAQRAPTASPATPGAPAPQATPATPAPAPQ